MDEKQFIRALSCHEAGHAVIARHFGRAIEAVRIDPTDESNPGKTDTSGAYLSIGQQILVLHAGAWFQERLGLGVEDDIDANEQILAMAAADFGRIAELIEESFPGRTDEAEKRFRSEAVALFAQPHLFAAVSTLADVLAVQRHLNRDQVHAIIDPHIGW